MATQLQDPQMLTRLLYPNPVCLLSTYAPPRHPNIMTITWLTPINNNVRKTFTLSSAHRIGRLYRKYEHQAAHCVDDLRCRGVWCVLVRLSASFLMMISAERADGGDGGHRGWHWKLFWIQNKQVAEF